MIDFKFLVVFIGVLTCLITWGAASIVLTEHVDGCGFTWISTNKKIDD